MQRPLWHSMPLEHALPSSSGTGGPPPVVDDAVWEADVGDIPPVLLLDEDGPAESKPSE